MNTLYCDQGKHWPLCINEECGCQCHNDYELSDEKPVDWQHDPEPEARGREEDRTYTDLRGGEVWGP